MPEPSLIAEALTDYFGIRCDTVDPDCACCRAWAELDRLRADRAERDRMKRRTACQIMAHRIREGMRDEAPATPVGGEGKVVEADETYFGKRETPVVSKQRKGRPYKFAKKAVTKRSVVGLVERGGNARLFHVQHATADSVREILVTNIPRDTTLHTDESRLYTETGKEFASHETVKHSAGEYVRGVIHTNTIEGVFSVFKRGMKGVYQHCGEAHLFRYLAEFEFRYNSRTALGFTDKERALKALKGIEGKRLTYRRIDEARYA
jgi:hypothetical protein